MPLALQERAGAGGCVERVGFRHPNPHIESDGMMGYYRCQPIEWPPVYTKDGKGIKHFDAVLGLPR